MSAEQLLYTIGSIKDDFIREAIPKKAAPRRSIPRWAALAAACLCLAVLIARVRPAALIDSIGTGGGPPSGSSADAGGSPPADMADPGDPGEEDLPNGCTLPGEIGQPLLYWQGTAYAWASVGAPGQPIGEPPENIDQWTELGPLAGVTAGETVEDLWLYADIGQVSGTVYADPEEHPGVLYVLMTTEWFEEKWVRFVGDTRLLQPVFFYGGALHYLDPCSFPAHNAVPELPEGYEPVGRLVYTADFDRLPDRDLAVSLCYTYPGSTLYVHPDRTDILYVECLRTWRGGSETVYAPATLTPQPWK